MRGVLAYLDRLGAEGSWATLDTETTGLGPYDVVIEAALIAADGTVLFDGEVRPERPITAKASAVHGLDAESLVGAPSWPSLWSDLQAHLRRTTVLAWNAPFDLRLLRQTCDRHDLPFQTPRAACLRAAFKELHPHVRGTLDAACLALGVPIRPNHRARQDAEVARRVALALMARSV